MFASGSSGYRAGGDLGVLLSSGRMLLVCSCTCITCTYICIRIMYVGELELDGESQCSWDTLATRDEVVGPILATDLGLNAYN